MYPNLAELRRLERETLKCISEMGEFGRFATMQGDARQAAAALIPGDRGPLNVHLHFMLEILLGGKLSPRRVDVGALVRETTDHHSIKGASYSVLICRLTEPTSSPILRKFHFDYEPITERNAAEPKPTVHLQMCGKLSPHHLAAGYTDIRLKHLYPQFEKPRIPCQPTSIALLLNWIFLEFQYDGGSQAVLKNPRWRNLVADAERTILVPYFESASKFLLSTAHRQQRFFQSHLYEIIGE